MNRNFLILLFSCSSSILILSRFSGLNLSPLGKFLWWLMCLPTLASVFILFLDLLIYTLIFELLPSQIAYLIFENSRSSSNRLQVFLSLPDASSHIYCHIIITLLLGSLYFCCHSRCYVKAFFFFLLSAFLFTSCHVSSSSLIFSFSFLY